jgi:hypothetical protein
LYFYIEAYDTKSPQANRSRTETFFISIPDTTRQETVVDDGLGVDLMPEYFRSQRQIIIDTEKLLKAKKQISAQDFKSTSNELANDQKVLRLRYGQFLGEEFESGIGPQEHDHEEEETHKEEEEDDLTRKYGHVHDKDNEHNLVEEKKAKPDELVHHHEETEDETESQGIPAAYIHQHDSEEEATFFTQSIRAKLKAALTVMWDAELYLRLYEPDKSLPYQYKALKLLKEISQDSRIYVHRTGFDPPPIKEEKRLSGDLLEIKSSTVGTFASRPIDYPYLRAAYNSIAMILAAPEIHITDSFNTQLIAAGQELASLAIDEPAAYLSALSLIRKITNEPMDQRSIRQDLRSIQKTLQQAIPHHTASPASNETGLHTLDQLLIETLNDNHE